MPKPMRFALFAALLTSFSSAVPINGNVLSGKIVDWPANLKEAEVRLTPWFSESPAVSAPVDASGRFTLPLDDLKQFPDRLVKASELFAKESVMGEGCQGQGQATPETAPMQMFLVEVWSGGQYYGDITLDNSASLVTKPGDAEANLMYFAQPTTLTGSVTCAPPYDNSLFKGRYPAGWNLVRGALTTHPAGTVNYNYDPAAPLTGLVWRLFKEYGHVGMSVDYVTGTIKKLTPGAPGEKAGLKVGDVIVSVDGKPLLESGGIRGEPNTRVVLVIRRDDKEQTFEITRAFTRWP